MRERVWVVLSGYYREFIGVSSTREGAKALAEERDAKMFSGKHEMIWDDDPLEVGPGESSTASESDLGYYVLQVVVQ